MHGNILQMHICIFVQNTLLSLYHMLWLGALFWKAEVTEETYDTALRNPMPMLNEIHFTTWVDFFSVNNSFHRFYSSDFHFFSHLACVYDPKNCEGIEKRQYGQLAGF